MEIQHKIIDTLPVFDSKESLGKAIDFFVETTYSHLAITENEVFLGCLSENELACLEPNVAIEKFRYELEAFCVPPEISWLDLLEKFARNEANIIPVVNKEGKVIGYFDLNDIVAAFIGTPFFTEPGGILVVEKGIRDYSFAEISQLVESNNTKLLGAFITDTKNDKVQVTLKLSAENLNEVIQSFRRYDYQIIYGTNDDLFMEDLRGRSDYLDKYLNV